ncbi:MAG: Dabb family protein [Eubacteriales bacterium]
MIRHIVMWKFLPGAGGKSREENIDEVKRRLYALYESGKIEGLRRMEIGKDISGTDMSYDMVLLTEFDSVEALNNYKVYPDHVAISEFVKTVRQARVVVDHEI